jgi:hypothetical protein
MKHIFAIGLIAVGFLLTLGATAWVYFNNLATQPTRGSLPDSIAGLQITNYTTGAEAITEFADLHGKEFPVSFGAIGIYGNREITLWVAGAPSASIALDMTNSMREKIEQGNSPFTPINEINDRNRKVYALEGMGQKHYYFQSENLVIWLAVDPAFADDALQQILEVYS